MSSPINGLPISQPGDIPGMTEALAAKATDTLVVHKAGDETIAGQKTFTDVIVNQSTIFGVTGNFGRYYVSATAHNYLLYDGDGNGSLIFRDDTRGAVVYRIATDGTVAIVTGLNSPIIAGGSASAGNLTIKSTSHATKGKVFLGTASVYDEASDRLGIGVLQPDRKMHVAGASHQYIHFESTTAGGVDVAMQFSDGTGATIYEGLLGNAAGAGKWGVYIAAGVRLCVLPASNVLVNATSAGSSAGQFEARSIDASTPILAGYDYLNVRKFLVGPDGTITVSTALKLPTSADAAIPNRGIAESTDTAGALKYRTNAGVLQTINVGASGGVALMFVATADKTIANTTTETTLFSTGSGTITIPPGTITPGKTYEIKLVGNVSAASGGYRIKLKLGGVVLYDTTSLTLTVANNQIIEIDATITGRSTGSTGTVMGWLGGKTYANTSSLRLGVSNVAFSVATVDTTIANDIDITWQMSAAAAGNTITIIGATIKALN